MSMQEAALYGDLVRYLRDKMAEMLVAIDAEEDVKVAGERLDKIIRDWFFSPQDDLYGSAPKDIIWREQLNLGNPLPPDYAHEVFDPDCDCPICQQMAKMMQEGGDLLAGQMGWGWTYSTDLPLIDQYDPEGSESRWEQERLLVQPQLDSDDTLSDLPTYEPPAVEDVEVSPEEFLERLNLQPQVDLRLELLSDQIIDRLDCPVKYEMFGPVYRHLEVPECVILLQALENQGVNLDELVAQIEAWPYENIALDWLSDPEQHVYFTIKAMETRLDPADKDALIRFRQHRDFLFILCQLIPYSARLWLQGWLTGMVMGQAQDEDEDEIDWEDGPLGSIDGDEGIPF